MAFQLSLAALYVEKTTVNALRPSHPNQTGFEFYQNERGRVEVQGYVVTTDDWDEPMSVLTTWKEYSVEQAKDLFNRVAKEGFCVADRLGLP